VSDRRRSIVGAVLPAACLLFVMLAGLGLGSYGQYVLAIGFISTTIGVALVLLVGFARVITLTSAAMMALGAYGSTLLVIHLGLPYWLSVIGAILIGGFSGWILAIPGVRFRSHNLAMVTLVFQAVVMILIREARRFTGGAEGITVEMACLYTSWLWPSRRSRTQKLSNHVIIPCSFTPFTRNTVTGSLFLRTLLRNVSCRLCGLSCDMARPLPLLSLSERDHRQLP